MILVTGATGTVGSELVRLLCETGTPTRALVRSPERGDALRGYDCEVVVGDFDDPPSLADALRQVDTAFLLSPSDERQVANETTFLDVAAKTDVRIVKLAALGLGVPEWGPIGAAHGRIVEHLRSLGLPHTVLAPNFFMQNLVRVAALVQERDVLPMPGGDAPVSFIDARDVAAVAAHVLRNGGHDGATYDLTGPQSLTYGEVAQQLSRVLGRDVQYVDLDPAQARDALVAAGLSTQFADALGALLAAGRAGRAAKVTDEVRVATGRDPRTMEQFLRDHRAAFAVPSR